MKLKELWITKLIIFFIINNFAHPFKIETWRYFKLCIPKKNIALWTFAI